MQKLPPPASPRAARRGGLCAWMGVWTFSIAYVATYLLFLDPDTLPRAFGRMVTRRSARRIAAS